MSSSVSAMVILKISFKCFYCECLLFFFIFPFFFFFFRFMGSMCRRVNVAVLCDAEVWALTKPITQIVNMAPNR